MHVSTQRYCIYQRNLFFRELTHGRTGSPEHPKENSRYMRTWDDIMHVNGTVRKGTVFIKGIYISGIYSSELTQGRWRPNIQKNSWFARTSKTDGKIADVRAWDDIMHKVHNGTVFIKGIYTSGNSRMAELVRPNIQKKIADTCIHEMILCMQSTQRYCIYQRNLYFRELTHGRTGSPEHPKENSRCAYMRWYYE